MPMAQRAHRHNLPRPRAFHAFLNDTNGGWAKDYIHWGEEKSGASIGGTREIGHGPQILQSTAGMTEDDAVPDAMIHP
jgi:hypothetical protein